jgi:hypothetical protein
MTPAYFDGTFRMTFERMSPDNSASWYFLETAGHGGVPLTFHTGDGTIIRVGSQMHGYDEGSVPHLFQSLVDPKAWARAYAFHDAIYMDHGWYVWMDGIWVFCEQTQYAADMMLQEMAIATGCPIYEAEAMFEGVHLGGGPIWDAHNGPFPVLPFLESERAP